MSCNCGCNEIEFSADEYIPMKVSSLPPYTGMTNIKPLLVAQTVPTAGYTMENNITVDAITLVDVANDYGTTAMIGGN